MSNRRHLVVRPARSARMSAFFRWLALTPAVRWRLAHHSAGHGPLYRGRLKAFLIQQPMRRPSAAAATPGSRG